LIVHLIRHGESVSNAEPGRDLPDATGDMLTERGHAQAAQAARHLTGLGITRLWSSPLLRARETAAPIAAELGLEIEIHDELRELREASGHGELSGEEQRLRRWSTWMAAHPGDPDHAPPGAESFNAMLARVEALKEAWLEHPEERILAVSHGILLRFLFVHSFLGREFVPAQVPRMWQLRTVNCGLSAFQHRPLGAGLAYPSPGEWLCLSWMARPWDPL
jgi:ribonuclease H / adenosylcobalamin/alpha-ribazole phosphatase